MTFLWRWIYLRVCEPSLPCRSRTWRHFWRSVKMDQAWSIVTRWPSRVSFFWVPNISESFTWVDFSCVVGGWIKKWVIDQVSVGVVDLGHVGGGWIERIHRGSEDFWHKTGSMLFWLRSVVFEMKDFIFHTRPRDFPQPPKNGEVALLLATNRWCVQKYVRQKFNESNN